MKRQAAIFPLFLLANILTVILLCIGLRVYFSPERLTEQLTQVFHGVDFSTVTGKTQRQPDGDLQIDAVVPNSQIQLQGLNIRTDLYQRLSLQFAEKPSQQSLLLSVGLNELSPVKVPVLYMDKQGISRFSIDELAAKGSIITDLLLSTPKLIDDYRLTAVTFEPRQLSTLQLLYLLSSDVRQLYLPVAQQRYFLLPAYQLVAGYGVGLLLIFAYLLHRARQPKSMAWWVSLAAIWCVLDMGYLSQASSSIQRLTWQDGLWFAAVFPPWLLGTAMSLPLLKRRYGYWWLAIGLGYLLGALLTSAELLAANFYSWSINWSLLGMGQCGLAAVLLYFFRPQRCSIEEMRLEKAPANRDYLLTLLLMVAAIIHAVLILDDLAAEISTLPVTFFTSSSEQWLLQYWQQRYADNPQALAVLWGTAIFAVAITIFGGLRYVGVALLPAMLSAYAVLSLPLWYHAPLSVLAYGHLLAVLSMLLLLIMLSLLYAYREYRLLLLLLPVAWVFISQSDGYQLILQGDLKALSAANLATDNAPLVNGLSVLFSESYLYLAAVPLSLLLWLLQPQQRAEEKSVQCLLLLTVLLIVPLIGRILVQFPLDIAANSVFISALILFLATVSSVIPACVYHLLNKDEETLPTI